MTARCIIQNRTEPICVSNLQSQKWRDRYQRPVGFRVYEFECDLKPAPISWDGRSSLYTQEPGHYFVSQTFRTVHGKPVGPFHPLVFFKSQHELLAHREQEIKKFIKSRKVPA